MILIKSIIRTIPCCFWKNLVHGGIREQNAPIVALRLSRGNTHVHDTPKQIVFDGTRPQRRTN